MVVLINKIQIMLFFLIIKLNIVMRLNLIDETNVPNLNDCT